MTSVPTPRKAANVTPPVLSPVNLERQGPEGSYPVCVRSERRVCDEVVSPGLLEREQLLYLRVLIEDPQEYLQQYKK